MRPIAWGDQFETYHCALKYLAMKIISWLLCLLIDETLVLPVDIEELSNSLHTEPKKSEILKYSVRSKYWRCIAV